MGAADEILLVDDHDHGGEQQLKQPHGHVVPRQEGRQGPIPEHMSHRHVHHGQQDADTSHQAAHHLGRLLVLQLRRCALGLLRRGGRRAVACLLHGLADALGGGGGFVVHPHLVGQQAHGHLFHAGHLGYGSFHVGAAGGAAHAGHIKLFHVDLQSFSVLLVRVIFP